MSGYIDNKQGSTRLIPSYTPTEYQRINREKHKFLITNYILKNVQKLKEHAFFSDIVDKIFTVTSVYKLKQFDGLRIVFIL